MRRNGCVACAANRDWSEAMEDIHAGIADKY